MAAYQKHCLKLSIEDTYSAANGARQLMMASYAP
jgi:hypothetical protein